MSPAILIILLIFQHDITVLKNKQLFNYKNINMHPSFGLIDNLESMLLDLIIMGGFRGADQHA